MNIIYYYWHPEQTPQKSREEDRGGFWYPFKLVLIGWREWKSTGRYPDPEELAKRIKPRFVDDINYLDELIERGKPKKDKQKDASQ
jgi:hypothetical protein